MSFTTSDLSVLAYANNFTLWHYTSIDTAAAIEGAHERGWYKCNR